MLDAGRIDCGGSGFFWMMLVICIAAFAVAAMAVRWTMRRAGRWGLVDEANHRSLHDGVKPRTGGLGILVGIGVGWIVSAGMGYPDGPVGLLGAGAIMVAAVSFLDDLRDTPALLRFTVHLAAGGVLLFAGLRLAAFEVPGLSLELGMVSGMILTLLFVVWFVNLFNFMDGMDGFAGGMAVFGFGFLTVLGLMGGEPGFALASATVAAAAAGFLLFNFPPARVFMGDVGSAPLGFLVAAFALWADSAAIAPLWVSVMIFSPFFLDATVTAGRRVLRRERFWEAHKSHYYQRSVEAGWSHRRTVLVEYLLMMGCGVSAMLIVDKVASVQWTVIMAWLALYSVCVLGIRNREARSSSAG